MVCVNGVFGERMADVAGRRGARVKVVEAPWGEAIDPEDVRRAVEGEKVRLVAVVHAETSAGSLFVRPELRLPSLVSVEVPDGSWTTDFGEYSHPLPRLLTTTKR